ncbi:MAG: aldehyde ferredoxin oxidoreductase family protein [Promethearchaeota archaeon]
MSYGYTGNILHVNLSTKETWIEHPEEGFYRKYCGGRALALYYMLKEMKPNTDVFSPENLLIFATSVIVGTRAPAINRYTVCAKSPLTGAQGESEAGGFWGPELKMAGFDAIIIRGCSEKPVYLWIKDGQVEIKDASKIWGKDTGEAQSLIRQELDDSRIRVALIGKGGENLVRYANIVNELSHFNGRNGLGAVMGSKRLKAIAVRGSKKIKVFDSERIKEISKSYAKKVMENPLSKGLRVNGTIGFISAGNQAGWLPTRNWTQAGFEKDEHYNIETFNKEYLKKVESCYACPVACKRVVEVNDGKIKVDRIYGGPEYETAVTFGSLCGVDDLTYVCKANELCARYTLDSISSGATIAFAIHCFEKGIIGKEDTDGLELKFGNKEEILTLLEKIANREGFGNLLAEGSQRAAQKIGKDAEKLLRVGKKQEIPMHDPRVKTGLGLQYALADYGADHMKAAHDPFFANKDSWGTKEMGGIGIYEPVSPTDISDKKVKLFKKLDVYWSLLDILGVCCFGWAPRGMGSLEELLDIINSITGWRTSWYELMQVAERSTNMARIFNLREGFTDKDDTMPEIFYENLKGGKLNNTGAINKKDFKKAVRTRYGLMGWDENTSVPNKGKLVDLDLDWLVGEVEKIK